MRKISSAKKKVSKSGKKSVSNTATFNKAAAAEFTQAEADFDAGYTEVPRTYEPVAVRQSSPARQSSPKRQSRFGAHPMERSSINAGGPNMFHNQELEDKIAAVQAEFNALLAQPKQPSQFRKAGNDGLEMDTFYKVMGEFYSND